MDYNRIKSLCDTATENEVLGYLLKKPSLILEPEFTLAPEDFTNQRNKLVFAVLSNMALQGAEIITPYDVDKELKNFPAQYEQYKYAGGIEGVLSLALDDDKIIDNTYHKVRWKIWQKMKIGLQSIPGSPNLSRSSITESSISPRSSAIIGRW